MKYERAARIEGQPQWHRITNNKPPKRWSSKEARRHAAELMREEDADTEPHLYWWDAEAA